MKSRTMEKILRVLLVLMGAGIGIAAAQLGLEMFRLANPDTAIPARYPIIGYTAAGVLGGLILLLLSRRIIRRFSVISAEMQKMLDRMPLYQIMSAVTGLIMGLIVAALLRQMLAFVGPGMFATAMTAILYLTLGALGYNIGKRRGREFSVLLTRVSGAREKSRTRHGFASRKYLDTSAIIDGRALEIARAGFLEGEILVPQFVVDELQRVADSSDESKRERGRHGLEMLAAMREQLSRLKIDEADEPEITDVDVKLLRQAKEWGGTVVTVDYNLQKAAAVSGIRVMNVNELAEAMRPAVIQGMEMSVRITREGKENGQGVGYLNDGTMIVIEGGKAFLGETADVTVTSVLQTSAGRMVFAKIKDRG